MNFPQVARVPASTCARFATLTFAAPPPEGGGRCREEDKLQKENYTGGFPI